MTRFLDGPAAGVTLMLRRAPFFLRAVRKPDGTWDALDQLDDRPEVDETLVVYQLVSEPTWMHVRATKGRSGVFRGGDYRLAANPLSDEDARDREKWPAWANREGPLRGQTSADDNLKALAAMRGDARRAGGIDDGGRYASLLIR